MSAHGQTYFYQVTALTTTSQESLPSATFSTVPNPFASNDAFLDYIQQANFDYFWYSANPANGLVPDRMREQFNSLGLQHCRGGVWADRHRHWH